MLFRCHKEIKGTTGVPVKRQSLSPFGGGQGAPDPHQWRYIFPYFVFCDCLHEGRTKSVFTLKKWLHNY